MGEYDAQQAADLRIRASRKLDLQMTRALAFQAYYDGDFDIIALMDTEERQVFKRFLEESAANWCELVVNAVAERLQVVGFRFQGADDLAWSIWQASRMDADAELVQTDALVQGCSLVLVQPDDDNPTGVSITSESAVQATVLYAAGDRRKRIAGYKRFTGDDETTVTEVLMLPDWIITWESDQAARARGGRAGDPVEVAANPAGFVGMVDIIPQPRTLGPPRSELTPAVPIQDRINTTIFNRMVGEDFGAFRQVWATGVKLMRTVVGTDPETGAPIIRPAPPYNVGANRLLTNENPDGKFGSLPEATLSGYLAAVEQDVNMLAAITQTPPHYLLGQMVNLSADAITAAETGLVSKVSRRALHIGEGYEDAMRSALRLVGSPGAADVTAEVIWKDFSVRSESQVVDALVKMATLGVPREVLWQRWGATPQQITRWKGMADAQAALDASNQATALGSPGAAYAALLGGPQPGPGTGTAPA